VIFKVAAEWGNAAQFNAELLAHGIQAMAFSKQSIRMVTHLDVDSQQIETTCQAIERIARRTA
jgi:threonine aldolase